MSANFTSRRNPAYVAIVGSSELYSGTLAATTTAAPLGASQAVSDVLVQNDPSSGQNVLIGDETSQTIVIIPGASITIPANDIAKVFAKAATSTATVNYLGRS